MLTGKTKLEATAWPCRMTPLVVITMNNFITLDIKILNAAMYNLKAMDTFDRFIYVTATFINQGNH